MQLDDLRSGVQILAAENSPRSPSPDIAGFSLRAASPADQAFRFELFRRSRPLEQALSHLDPALVAKLMHDQFRAQLQAYRSQFPHARTDIIELHGQPVGIVVVDRMGHAIHVVDLAVTPCRRGLGIGSTTLRGILDEGQKLGRAVRLSVAQDNVVARSLYARLGFKATTTSATYVFMEWCPDTILS